MLHLPKGMLALAVDRRKASDQIVERCQEECFETVGIKKNKVSLDTVAKEEQMEMCATTSHSGTSETSILVVLYHIHEHQQARRTRKQASKFIMSIIWTI